MKLRGDFVFSKAVFHYLWHT